MYLMVSIRPLSHLFRQMGWLSKKGVGVRKQAPLIRTQQLYLGSQPFLKIFSFNARFRCQGRFLWGTFFLLRLQTELFMLSKSVTAPQREEIEPALLGMGLTTRGEVSRPFSRFSIVAVARISD